MVFAGAQKIAADMAHYCYGYFVCWSNVASRKSLWNYGNRYRSCFGTNHNAARDVIDSIPLQEEVACTIINFDNNKYDKFNKICFYALG